MKRQCVLLFLSAILLLTFTSPARAATSTYSDIMLDTSTQTLPVSSAKTLFVDKINHQIQLLEISTGKIAWTKKFPALYDCEVLTYPTKIVVITKENGKLLKVTFSEEGKQLSQQIFSAIKLTENEKLQWSAAGLHEKERLAIVNEDRLLVYQYPWKKPDIDLTITSPEDHKYESAVLEDVQFRSPYTVVQYNGSSLDQSKDYYKIINLATSKVSVIPLAWNVNSSFAVEGTTLVVDTSSISGSPLGIDTNVEQTIYTRYDLMSGQAITNIKRTFTLSDSNWSSSYFNGHLLLTDTEQGQSALLDRNGQLVAERTAAPADLNCRLVGYYNGKAYTLVWTADRTLELHADFIK